MCVRLELVYVYLCLPWKIVYAEPWVYFDKIQKWPAVATNIQP